MREFLLNLSTCANEKYRAAVLDMRADILTGLLIPLFALGWLGMAYALALSPARPEWAIAITFAAVLIFGLICAWLNWSGRHGVAVWVFPFGLWSIAACYFLISQDTLSLIWIAIACVLITLLIGTVTGTVAVILTAACALWVASTAGRSVTASGLIPIVVPLGLLVLVTHILVRALLHTLRWMSEGYELAHQQADQLRDKSAELEAALKSLGQTSFALARANEQLEIMGKFAEDARRSKQEFVASVSHELRTPLNLIIGFSDLILNAPATYNMRRLPPGMLADIHVIHQNAQHLLKMVNDILDMSQMDVAYMTITREPTHLDSFVQTALHDFAPLVESRGLTLQVQVKPGLPEIYLDKTRIRQVLLNLVANAMRFTESGGILIRVCQLEDTTQSSFAGNPADIVISVTDTGVGIAPEDLQRIFEPFTKIDRSAKQLGGTGLGLTISKRFVVLHGGHMWVESTLHEGSSFYFTLPLTPPPFEAPTQGTLRQVHRQEVGALMVVERTPILSRLLDHRLEGIKICHVRTVDELVATSVSSPPEAILINQPLANSGADREKLDGFKDVPIIRCYVPDFPVAPGKNLFQANAVTDELSIRRYLIKPVTRESFHEITSEMLSPGSEERRRESHLPKASKVTRSARILVVEDDEDALHLLGRLLRSLPDEIKQGYDTIIPVEMRSGEQALEYLRALETQTIMDLDVAEETPANAIDGVMLDLNLGAVSGFDLLHELDNHPALRHIPVCIVSGQEASGGVLVTPYINVSRQPGLSARELTDVVATLMQVMLPGIDVTIRQNAAKSPELQTSATQSIVLH